MRRSGLSANLPLLLLFGVASFSTLGITRYPAFGRATAAITPAARLETRPRFKNWGLVNDESNSHISAPQAWEIEQGSRDVIVAVIDTGIDPSHPDLVDNIWSKADPSPAPTPLAARTVLRPASGGGRIAYAEPVARKVPSRFDGRVYGWDFVTNTANPLDDHGHGTHVAGIIGAVANPKEGTSGVAHRVSIMAVKYYSESSPGSVNLANTVKAIGFAVENGARIINYSGGGDEFSEEEYLAIKKAEAKGVLFVAAAGNEHEDTDRVENYYYPAAYRVSNLISVAATDIHNKLLASSNWGKTRVDVAAPGENIYSTVPKNKFGYMSGTSQATAFVTGLAALLLSKDPSLTPQQIREIILASVDSVPSLKDRVLTGGRVNAYAALAKLAARNEAGRALAVGPSKILPFASGPAAFAGAAAR